MGNMNLCLTQLCPGPYGFAVDRYMRGMFVFDDLLHDIINDLEKAAWLLKSENRKI